MTSIPLSSDTRSRLVALFDSDDRVEAERLLVEECGSSLPFHESSDAESLERIRFAAMKVSGGDVEALASAIDLANVDWRDLLVAAGFARDVSAHRQWSPDRYGAQEE